MDTKKTSWLLQLLVLVVVSLCMSVQNVRAALACPGTTSGGCVAEIGISTPAATGVLVTTGPGTLINIVISSVTAAAGDFCVAFDSASTSGLTLESDGKAAAPRIMGTSIVAANTVTAQPAGAPAVPYTNGIVIFCKAVTRAFAILSR